MCMWVLYKYFFLVYFLYERKWLIMWKKETAQNSMQVISIQEWSEI